MSCALRAPGTYAQQRQEWPEGHDGNGIPVGVRATSAPSPTSVSPRGGGQESWAALCPLQAPLLWASVSPCAFLPQRQHSSLASKNTAIYIPESRGLSDNGSSVAFHGVLGRATEMTPRHIPPARPLRSLAHPAPAAAPPPAPRAGASKCQARGPPHRARALTRVGGSQPAGPAGATGQPGKKDTRRAFTLGSWGLQPAWEQGKRPAQRHPCRRAQRRPHPCAQRPRSWSLITCADYEDTAVQRRWCQPG